MRPSSPTLVVLAAGRSTRYGRLKQLEPVGPAGEALMDFGIHDAWRAGVRRVVVVVRTGIEDRVVEHVRALVGRAMTVRAARQTVDALPEGARRAGGRTKPWGTAHAVWCARRVLAPGPFLVMNADDFYGAAALGRLAAWARSDPPPDELALVPFRLDRCISGAGGVSRGICRVDERGFLTTIEEVLDVRPRGELGGAGGVSYRGRSPEGRPVTLRGEELCSLNLWGLAPAIHPLIESEMHGFLEGTEARGEAELYLPEVVHAGIRRGEVTVRILEEGESHAGLTHAGDRDDVRRLLRRVTERGSYPSPLRRAFTTPDGGPAPTPGSS